MAMIELQVGAKSYSGWKKIVIVKDMDAIAHYFVLEHQDYSNKARFNTDDLCEIYIDKELVLTGYVERIDQSISKDNYSIKISGRSKSSDLVDSHPDIAPCEFKNASVDEIISELLGQHQIKLSNEVKTPLRRFEKWSIDPFLTISDNINDLCKQADIYIFSNEDGDLLLKDGPDLSNISVLRQGENILSLDITKRSDNLKSQYNIYSNEIIGTSRKSVEVVSEHSKRQRRYNLNSGLDQKSLFDLGKAEKNNIEKNFFSAVAVVDGWHTGKILWAENTVVQLEYPFFDLNDSYTVKKVCFLQDEKSGRKTHLELTL